MSSTFVTTVINRPRPNVSIWRVRNTTAGGPNNYVCTRSFVLSALGEVENSQEISNIGYENLSLDTWFEENVDKYVKDVRYFVRVNEQPDDEWPSNTDELVNADLGFPREREDKLCETFHHVYLVVETTNPVYLDNLPEVFETVASDWWWNDPLRKDYSENDIEIGDYSYLEKIIQELVDDLTDKDAESN